MANRLERVLKKGYNFIKKNTPAPVKNFVAPILNPAVQFVKPVIKDIDKGIDAGVEAAKKLAAEAERKRKAAEAEKERKRLEKERLKKEKAEAEKKAYQEGLKREREKIARVEKERRENGNPIQAFGDLTTDAVKVAAETPKSIEIGINNMFVSFEKFKKNIADENLQNAKDPDRFATYRYGASGSAQYTKDKKENNLINPVDDKAIKRLESNLFEYKKGYDVKVAIGKEMREQRQATLNNIDSYKKNTAFKMSADFYNGFVEQVSNPIELTKNAVFDMATAGGGKVGLAIGVGLNIVDNLYTTQQEIKTYEGRDMTGDEALMSTFTGAVIPLGIHGIKKIAGAGRINADIITEKAVLGHLDNEFSPNVTPVEMKRMFELDQDLRTTEGHFKTRNFAEKVQQKIITPENYQIEKDPVKVMTTPSYIKESLDSSKVTNPNAPVFYKHIEAIPDEYQPINKLNQTLVGTAREKQYFIDNITAPFEQNFVGSVENTVKAYDLEYKTALSKTLPGEEIVVNSKINTGEMSKKITQDLIIAPFENTHKRTMLAEKTLIDTMTENRFSSPSEMIGFIDNHDENYLSKIYMGIDDSAPNIKDFDTTGLREYIGIRKNTNDKILQFNKRWQVLDEAFNDINVHEVIARNAPLFDAGESMRPNQMVKLALNRFDKIESRDTKLLYNFFDHDSMKLEVENVIKKGLSDEFDFDNLDIETLNLIKDTENILKTSGQRQVYDFDKQEFVSIKKKPSASQFELSEIVEEYLTGLNKMELPEKPFIINEEGKLVKNRKYKTKAFSFLSEENLENARLESVVNKPFILRQFEMFDKLEEFIPEDLGERINAEGIFKNEEQKFRFQNEVEPLINAYFDIPYGATTLEKAEIYRHYLIDLKSTTKASHIQGEVMEMGNLIKYFGSPENMKLFYAEGEGFMKTNEQFYKSNILNNVKKQAEYETFGMPAYALRGRLQFGILNKPELWENIQGNTRYVNMVNQLKQDSLMALDNVVIGSGGDKIKGSNALKTIAGGTTKLLTRSYLGIRGMYEPTTNKSLSVKRGLKYSTSNSLKAKMHIDNFLSVPKGVVQVSGSALDLTGNAVRHLPLLEKLGLKMMKAGEEILSEGKIGKFNMREKGLLIEVIDDVMLKDKSGNLIKDTWNSLGDMLMRGDKSSDEINRAVQVTFITHENIKDGFRFDYEKINPNLKQALKSNGVDELNYKDFQTYVKNYFNENNVINAYELSELAITDKNARKLLNIYDALYYDNQKINKSGLYKHGSFSVYQIAENLNTLFRKFAIGANSEDIRSIFYYTNQEGVYRNRWTTLEGYGNTAKNLVSPVGIVPTLLVTSFAGETYNFVRDLVSGKRDAYKTLSMKMGEDLTFLSKVLNPETDGERATAVAGKIGNGLFKPFLDGYNSLTSATDITDLFKNVAKSTLNLDEGVDYDYENYYIAAGETGLNLIFGRHFTNIVKRGLTSKDEKQMDLDFLKNIKDPEMREEVKALHDSFFENGFSETMKMYGNRMTYEMKGYMYGEMNKFMADKDIQKEVYGEMKKTGEEVLTNHYNDVSGSYRESIDNLYKEGFITKEQYNELLEEAKNINIDVINKQFSSFSDEEKKYFEILKSYERIDNKDDEMKLKLDYMNLLSTLDKRDAENIAGAITKIVGDENWEDFINHAQEMKKNKGKQTSSANISSDAKTYILQSVAVGEYSISDINNPKVLGRASLDTWGSASFGILGMNTKTGSFQQFMNKNAGKLGLKTGSRSYYESQEFRSQFAQKAAENPELMKQLQSDYAYDDYLPNKLNGKTTKEFLKSVKNDPAFYNNLAINVLLADGAIQTGTIVPNRIKSFARNYNFTTAEKFIKDYTAVNKQHINGDFRSALADQSASYQGLVRRNNVREDASLNVVEFDLE